MAEDGRASEVPQPARTTRAVKVVDIARGDSRSIVIVERLCTLGGKKRHFTQEVKVLDDQLFQRLLAEVRKGDEIEAVVVTEFSEQGYTTYLANFSK